ncbi:glutaredoxin [Chitinivorax tropicus]|uniref:Glutaredoxin n=1 Tax=Chitinivorax tropicus TaxID=714531 RepID=A0A840MT86_9PROT|nr:glutaredoxin family protein [Chitinivorax tropicus]MBB5020427.1 glutaredoxin [Chitinivorax tropicus]
MFRHSLIALMLLSLAGGVVAGQVYTWTDPATGKTVFSDQPPPPHIKGQQKDFKGSTIQTSVQGYAMQEAIRKNPVTLFSSDCGDVCTNARQLLIKRGIPYTLKNPGTQQAYMDELKKLSGSDQVPVLIVGSKATNGFEASSWHSALDAAGYPKAESPAMANKPKETVATPPSKTGDGNP